LIIIITTTTIIIIRKMPVAVMLHHHLNSIPVLAQHTEDANNPRYNLQMQIYYVPSPQLPPVKIQKQEDNLAIEELTVRAEFERKFDGVVELD
jgi:hypothetical protein